MSFFRHIIIYFQLQLSKKVLKIFFSTRINPQHRTLYTLMFSTFSAFAISRRFYNVFRAPPEICGIQKSFSFWSNHECLGLTKYNSLVWDAHVQRQRVSLFLSVSLRLRVNYNKTLCARCLFLITMLLKVKSWYVFKLYLQHLSSLAVFKKKEINTFDVKLKNSLAILYCL